MIVIGLSMKLVGSSHHDCVYFKYEHNINYQKIQKRFLQAVDSLDHTHVVVSSQSVSQRIFLLSTVLVQMSVTIFPIIKGHYFTWLSASLFTQAILHDGGQHSNHCCSNLSWVTVNMFYFSVLQLILGFYLPYLKKVLEIVSLGSQTSITQNSCSVHCTSEFWW